MTRHKATLFLLATIAATVTPTFAVVNLAATIRDFNNSDSSFNATGPGRNCPGTGYVESILGPNRKPVPTHKIDLSCTPGDSLRMATDWFTTDPTYTNSATTCIDIPMTVDTAGTYTYRNPYFFPIDTFNILPNGSINPFNVKSRGDDGRQHNFSFCMEMHGTFDSRPGQTFSFLGDDDVWFFVNNRLVVDLGGVHVAESSSVNLDTLGLTPGQTYPWDFFFCERHTSGSDILINTSMNLRTSSNFSISDSVLGPAHHLYSLWVDQSNASSCVASRTRSSGSGQFTLTGSGIVGTKTLPPGTSYGGIVVDPSLGSIGVDSTAITGLAPGNYVLHITEQGNLASSKDVPFVVPLIKRALRFTDSSWTNLNPAAIVTDVTRPYPVFLEVFKDGAFCPVCRDSVTFAVGNAHLRILGSPTGPALTSIRLVGGKAQVWVVSNLPVDASSITASSDSSASAVRSPVSVIAPRLVFVDASGNVLTQLPAINIPVGGKFTVNVELLTSTGLCTACSDSLLVSVSSNRLQILDAAGHPITRLVINGGKASFQLTGWAPIQNGSFSVTTDSLRTSATWSPVTINLAAASGVLIDSNADGKADLLHLSLPVDASSFSSLFVSWPGTNGNLETHQVPLPSSGKNLSLPVTPFAFASTSCPVEGCANLGQLVISHGTDTALLPFPVLDGVNPIPTIAQYRFSATGLTPDTLIVHFSEPVQTSGSGTAPWVSTGKPGLSSLGTALSPLFPGTLTGDLKVASFLVDSSNKILPGDSLRIAAAPTGALSDLPGNAPGDLAWWTPIVWGTPPAMLTLRVPVPVVQLGGITPPFGEPPITVLIHPTDSTTWVAPQGTTPSPNDLKTRFGGVVVRLNRIPENLGMYVYDNIGVLVLRQDLPSIAKLVASGVLQRDRRGNYEIWLAWDGKDGKGRDAATGVYLIRVYGWLKEGTRLYFLNQIKTNGLHRAL